MQLDEFSALTREQLISRVKGLELRNAQLTSELEQMRNATLWRLTAPLRAATEFLRGRPVATQIEPVEAQPSIQSIPLATAAESSVVVDPGGHARRQDVPHFEHPERNPFFDWKPDPAEIRVWQLRNVVLDAFGYALFSDGARLAETVYLLGPEHERPVEAERLQHLPDEGIVVVGCNAFVNNYYHWSAQALPAIDLSIRHLQLASPDTPIQLALPPLRPWHMESLQALGYGDIPRLELDPARQYHLPRAVYCDILNGGMSFALSKAAAETGQRIRQALAPKGPPRRAIYIARTDAWQRRLRNEAAMIELAGRFGLETVVPGNLSFQEQVTTFAGARLVVGAHGAGLSNVAYCRPGTVVYELVPGHYRNLCFRTIADQCGLIYWADAFTSDGIGPPVMRDWEVDLGMVSARLAELSRICATADPICLE